MRALSAWVRFSVLWRFGALAFRYGALYPPRPFWRLWFGLVEIPAGARRSAAGCSVFRLGNGVRSSAVERPV